MTRKEKAPCGGAMPGAADGKGGMKVGYERDSDATGA